MIAAKRKEKIYLAKHRWLENDIGHKYLSYDVQLQKLYLSDSSERLGKKTKFTCSELMRIGIWDSSDWEFIEVFEK